MNTGEVAAYWEQNAKAWTTMARMGFDVCRNHLNAPAFIKLLPDVSGLTGLDVGCGEGFNTRMVADKGAKLVGVDVSQTFISFAIESETNDPRGIEYMVASATDLPFALASFDFAMATISMMDIPNLELAVTEIYRILKPGGFFQFSICHPCFSTPAYAWVEDENGEPAGLVCGDYFNDELEKVLEWTFTSAPENVRSQFENFIVPTYFKTLSGWLNMLLDNGFVLERFLEPCPDAETQEIYPTLKGAAKVALFLHIRCRKPL